MKCDASVDGTFTTNCVSSRVIHHPSARHTDHQPGHSTKMRSYEPRLFLKILFRSLATRKLVASFCFHNYAAFLQNIEIQYRIRSCAVDRNSFSVGLTIQTKSVITGSWLTRFRVTRICTYMDTQYDYSYLNSLSTSTSKAISTLYRYINTVLKHHVLLYFQLYLFLRKHTRHYLLHILIISHHHLSIQPPTHRSIYPSI
jgi:hypothetical protein